VAYYTQDGIAVAIIHEGQRRKVSQKGIQIALSTGLVESDLYMHCNDNDAESKSYPYDKVSYDYDSSGVFQQRPAYWGTAQQRMDVAHSAGMFYDALNGYNYDSEENTPGWYAYQVQKCAAEYAYRYDERYPEACEYYNRLAWMECPHQPGDCRVAGSIGPLVSPTAEPEIDPGVELRGEVVLEYDSSIVPQETGYWCGPAATQVCLNTKGVFISEQQLANEMGTHSGGTDYIGQLETVLDSYLPGALYDTVDQPHDPMSSEDKERLWSNLVRSINSGHGVPMNWVAPPGNYPVGVKGSQSPSYGGGTVFHYVAAMGYDDNPHARAVWMADSGFNPFEYWISFDQCCTLIPPKGYVYAAYEGEAEMSGLTAEEHDKLMQLWGAFFNPVASASEYAPPDEGEIHATKDMLRYTDGNIYSILTEHRAMLGDPHFVGVVKATADRGSAWAQHVYDLIPDEYKK
jgi:hypothetical protein